MPPRKPRRVPPPLTQPRLEELALRYVGRYATTRAKLRAYLARKLRERGWDGEREPDPERIAGRFAELGYVDDAAFAMSKSVSLTSRGYGTRRLAQSLRVAGVGDEDGAAARAHAEEEAVEAALRFARRRRIGPFAGGPTDPKAREKALAALVRAGHGFALARQIVALEPGAAIDAELLRERSAGGTA